VAAASPTAGVVEHVHPRVRGGLALRLASLVFGLFLFALAIVLTLESRLGLWPWDVLHQGIARHTPLTFGLANVVVGVVVLAISWALGGKPGLGTVANAVLIGLFIQLLTSLDAVQDLGDASLPVRVGLLAAGIALAGPGSAFYIGADLGAGPRDTLMLVGRLRSGRRIGLVRFAIEAAVLVLGIALGGTFGVGTVAFALFVGPVVEASFWLLARTPLTDAARPAPAPAAGA
jgi:uncharacterized protein